MKRKIILIILMANACLAKAQRLFFVEPGSMAEAPVKQALLKASQFIAKSPMASEYIIKTALGSETNSKMPTIKIQLVDSITFKTIFEVEEEYTTRVQYIQPQAALKMAMYTLIEKNIKEIIFQAKRR